MAAPLGLRGWITLPLEDLAGFHVLATGIFRINHRMSKAQVPSAEKRRNLTSLKPTDARSLKTLLAKHSKKTLD
jgi:hypothetical protein